MSLYQHNRRGFFGIGIYHVKSEANIGGLMRSAFNFGANFCYTVGRRYSHKSADTCDTARHIPIYHYRDIDDLVDHLPQDCMLVGVEKCETSYPVNNFTHPERACYLLGAEDYGLQHRQISMCHRVVEVPNTNLCLNVSTCGGIILYDRWLKSQTKFPK